VIYAVVALCLTLAVALFGLIELAAGQLRSKDALVEALRRDVEAERLMWTQERLGMLERLDALRVPSLVVGEPVALPAPPVQTDVSEEAEYLANERERLTAVLAENGYE
jgi:hypothetical protein